MDKKSSGVRHSPTWYFIFALVFALIAIPASKLTPVEYTSFFFRTRIDLGWIFWVLIILSVLSTLPLFKAILLALHDRHRLPQMLRYFLEDPLVSKVQRIKNIGSVWIYSRFGKLVLACITTFTMISFLWRSGAIPDDKLDSFLYGLVDAFSKPSLFHGLSDVTQVHFTTYSGNYFRDCLELVRDLKSAGAKAVLVGLPRIADGRVGRPSVNSDAWEYVRKLDETGVVVFASEYGFNVRVADAQGEIKSSKGALGLDERSLDENIRLSRIRLTGIQDAYNNSLDVALEVLRKYRDFAHDLSVRQEGGELVFGDYRIPVTKDGYSYSRDRVTWWTSFEIFAYKGLMQHDDTLRYGFWDDRLDQRRSKTKEELASRVKGKIVLLHDSFGRTSLLYARAYAVTIQNILEKKMLWKWESFHLWISLVCLMLAAFIAYRFRFFIAIPLMFFLGLFTLLFCAYLYDSHNILVDIFYPLLSTAVAMATFPFIAMRSES